MELIDDRLQKKGVDGDVKRPDEFEIGTDWQVVLPTAPSASMVLENCPK